MVSKMIEFRCLNCNKLIFKYKLKGSIAIQVKCTRCGMVSKITLKNEVKADE